mmetsp:Transcript_99113/g.289195  ORF Transcript_99113/g.289195 Transcript_99113/m.289195 type:complete len:208 (+) Transcript_99113:318-941(+)
MQTRTPASRMRCLPAIQKMRQSTAMPFSAASPSLTSGRCSSSHGSHLSVPPTFTWTGRSNHGAHALSWWTSWVPEVGAPQQATRTSRAARSAASRRSSRRPRARPRQWCPCGSSTLTFLTSSAPKSNVGKPGQTGIHYVWRSKCPAFPAVFFLQHAHCGWAVEGPLARKGQSLLPSDISVCLWHHCLRDPHRPHPGVASRPGSQVAV